MDKKREAAAIVLKAVLALFLTAALLFGNAGCGQREPLGDPVQAYEAVIHELEDPGSFNSKGDIEYISIDTRGMTGLSGKDDESRLLSELEESYGLEILDKNQVQLLQNGYLVNNLFEDGLLFKIAEANYSTYDKSPVFIEVLEWGRGEETLCHKRFTLEIRDGRWEITDQEDVAEKTLN